MTTLLASDLTEGDLALLARREGARVGSTGGQVPRWTGGAERRSMMAPVPTRLASTTVILRPARRSPTGWVPPGWPGKSPESSGVMHACL